MRFNASAALVVCLLLSGPRAEVWAQAAPNKTPFPDFGAGNAPQPAPATLFRLSQDYPSTLPDASRKPKFFSSDFRADWHGYMMQARDYCFEGNTPNWVVQNNPVRKWYHMPWQHWGLNGREGLHGLTKEAQVQPQQLGVAQTIVNGQTYAVGMFNEFAAYGIGVVWSDHMNPSLDKFNAMGGFPEGSVVCKLLFVDTPTNQVAYLSSPIQWQAYITQGYSGFRRSVQTVSLIQMDIAVKDKRAPTQWIFGTFVYNGQLLNQDPWKNLVPLGLMWGNDPGVNGDQYTNPVPAETRINPELKETVINRNRAHGALELPPMHLGWNGRLNGPVDNPNSSCMSCHMTAEFPQISPQNPTFSSSPPPRGGTAWMRWFQNNQCNTPFDPGQAQSADFSLQLAGALQNFDTWKQEQDGFTVEVTPPPSNAAAPAARTPTATPKAKPKIYPVIRDQR